MSGLGGTGGTGVMTEEDRAAGFAGQAVGLGESRTAGLAESEALGTLHRVFGYEAFRGEQEAVIEHVVAGGDAVVLMPTGGGKSLCYQIPALVRPGTGVVVSPLIALMQDQVDALRALGVRAGFMNSTQDFDERRVVEAEFLAGELDLLYLAPERLRLESTLRAARPRQDLASSRSTRRTACPSGATTSAPTTWRSRCWASAGPTCRASR